MLQKIKFGSVEISVFHQFMKQYKIIEEAVDTEKVYRNIKKLDNNVT